MSTEKTERSAEDLGLNTDQPTTHAESVRKLADAMWRTSIWPVLAVVIVGVTVSTLFAGIEGTLGALVGAAVAIASSLATLWVMRKTAAMDPTLVMAAALGGFVGKMLVLLVVMMLLRGVTMFHTESLAFTMLAVVLVSAAADAVAFRRTKIPTLIINSDNK